MSDELRSSLWSLLKIYVWDKVFYSQAYGGRFLDATSNPEMRRFCRLLWFQYFKKPLDTLPGEFGEVQQFLRTYFFECPWHGVYDFIEFVAINFPYNQRDEFIKDSNTVLQTEFSAYRFIGPSIAPITEAVEVDEIEQATGQGRATVRTHLRRALELISDRKSPDYRNSIKESVSAVESLVSILLGEKGTLGQLIKQLGDEIDLHPALRTAFSNLYGYTSDEGGIRHALLESENITFEDAKFFLVVCSAFINFVENKVVLRTSPDRKGC